MTKAFFITPLLAILLTGACTRHDEGADYRWRESWDKTQIPEGPENPDLPAIKGKPRYVWIDAAANFTVYADDVAAIEEDCRKIARMGFTDIIVDVRPTSGDVLFHSAVAPACRKVAAWVNGRYRWVERTADFDYLAAFIAAGHAAGLRVNAALNTMVGAYRSSIGDVGMLFDESGKRGWGTVDNLPGKGLTNTLDDTDTGPRFLDPAHPDVQEFLWTMLEEVAGYEGLDGIVLDRCRYDDYGLDAGYTDAALAAFTEYLGEAPSSWPVMPLGQSSVSNPSTLQRNWLTFRCQVLHDFVATAAARVHSVAPDIRFGVYVGAWFSDYYTSGVNWSSSTYDLRKNESTYKWAPDRYQKTGFADLLDFIFLGAYASTSGIHGNGEWTMEGFAKLGARRLNGAVPFAAGPDIGNSSGFEAGKQEALIPEIVSTMMGSAGGLFIFDLCHIRMFDYWDAFETGINQYLETL